MVVHIVVCWLRGGLLPVVCVLAALTLPPVAIMAPHSLPHSHPADAMAETTRCREEEYLEFQKLCRKENLVLEQASAHQKHGHDSAMVCSALFEMWSCVATHVPRCFEDFTHLFATYLHSPYNCYERVNATLITKLQDLTRMTATEQGLEGVGTEVDLVILTPTPPGPNPPEEEEQGGETKGSGDGDGEDGEETENTDVTVSKDGGVGGADRHSGNGSPQTVRSSSVLSAVVILWLLTSQMTSWCWLC